VSIGMGIIVLFHIYQALFRPGAIDELTKMKESEEELIAVAHSEETEAPQERKQGVVGGER
ncbi:C4-dicarboxylate ABC transporter permease, partial [Geobacillus sp. 46C-IIa]